MTPQPVQTGPDIMAMSGDGHPRQTWNFYICLYSLTATHFSTQAWGNFVAPTASLWRFLAGGSISMEEWRNICGKI